MEGKVSLPDEFERPAKRPKAIQLKLSVAEQEDQPSLVKLGRDILIMVFDLIQETNPKSLHAIGLVNSEFYHLADHSRHRHLTLNLEPSMIYISQKRLRHIAEQKLLSAIRFLDVSEPGEINFKHRQAYPKGIAFATDTDGYHDCIKSIGNLIPSMTGLKDVSWNYSGYDDESIPDTVLEVLRSRPRVRLHVKVRPRSRRLASHPTRQDLQKLQNNANLSKLKAEVEYYDAKDCLEATQPLKRILLSSPNLRSLSLAIYQPKSGCVVYGVPREYHGLGFVDDEAISPLEELVISEYPWGYESTDAPDGRLVRGRQTGYPGKKSEMDYWAEKFDWSRLQRLKTVYVDFALKIMPKLTSLKEVDFFRSGSTDDIIRFYQQCPAALEAIGAESLHAITLRGVLRHGSALRKLRLHTVEDYNGRWAEGAMDAASLRIIRDGCALIEELFVDISRDGDWPWETLDVLSSFPRLRNLAICFEVGVKCRNDPVKPYVTFTSAITLFTYLRSHSPKQTSILSRLHIYSGAPPPTGHGLLAPSAFWPQYNSTEFICSLSERDDEAAKGIFEVVCPKLPRETKSRKSGHSFEPSMRDGTRNSTWNVAHEGPTPMSKWGSHY